MVGAAEGKERMLKAAEERAKRQRLMGGGKLGGWSAGAVGQWACMGEEAPRDPPPPRRAPHPSGPAAKKKAGKIQFFLSKER